MENLNIPHEDILLICKLLKKGEWDLALPECQSIFYKNIDPKFESEKNNIKPEFLN